MSPPLGATVGKPLPQGISWAKACGVLHDAGPRALDKAPEVAKTKRRTTGLNCTSQVPSRGEFPSHLKISRKKKVAGDLSASLPLREMETKTAVRSPLALVSRQSRNDKGSSWGRTRGNPRFQVEGRQMAKHHSKTVRHIISKLERQLTTGSWNPFPGTTSGENYPSYRHVHPNVACTATDSNHGRNAKMSIVHVNGLEQCLRCVKGRDSAKREEKHEARSGWTCRGSQGPTEVTLSRIPYATASRWNLK